MPGYVKWLALLFTFVVLAVGYRLYKKEQNATLLNPVSAGSTSQSSSSNSQAVAPEAVAAVSADPADYAEKAVASAQTPQVCLRKPDGVATEVKSAELLVTNCTTDEVCYLVVEGLPSKAAAVWCDKPLAAGASGAVSIAKFDRKITEAIEFKWWHKGKKIAGTDTYGADHVRSEIVRLTPAS